jgi:hypothetical protein
MVAEPVASVVADMLPVSAPVGGASTDASETRTLPPDAMSLTRGCVGPGAEMRNFRVTDACAASRCALS